MQHKHLPCHISPSHQRRVPNRCRDPLSWPQGRFRTSLKETPPCNKIPTWRRSCSWYSHQFRSNMTQLPSATPPSEHDGLHLDMACALGSEVSKQTPSAHPDMRLRKVINPGMQNWYAWSEHFACPQHEQLINLVRHVWP